MGHCQNTMFDKPFRINISLHGFLKKRQPFPRWKRLSSLYTIGFFHALLKFLFQPPGQGCRICPGNCLQRFRLQKQRLHPLWRIFLSRFLYNALSSLSISALAIKENQRGQHSTNCKLSVHRRIAFICLQKLLQCFRCAAFQAEHVPQQIVPKNLRPSSLIP